MKNIHILLVRIFQEKRVDQLSFIRKIMSLYLALMLVESLCTRN